MLASLAGGWVFQIKRRHNLSARRSEAQQILEDARREADSLLREARLAANEESLRIRSETEKGFATRRDELIARERRLAEREAVISHQIDGLMKEEQRLREQGAEWQRKFEQVEMLRKEVVELVAGRRRELESVAGLSSDEARSQILKQAEDDAARDAAAVSHRIVEEARTGAEERARKIISVAIQRYAGEHTFESTTATVALTGDEIKGRIIGREGRNIRAFEAATGVTVLIDDTPNAVVLSGFA